MKEIEKHDKAPQEMIQTAPIQKQKKLMASLSPHPGHVMFRMNLNTLLVERVQDSEYESFVETEWVKGKAVTQKRRKLTSLPGHLYCAALNKKNAYKKFGKMLQDGSRVVKFETPDNTDESEQKTDLS